MMTSRSLRRAILGLSLLCALDWGLGRVLLSDGTFLGRAVAPFDPPLFCASQKETLARIEAEVAAGKSGGKFDSEIGWCNKPNSGFGEFRYDWAGARIGQRELARSKAPGTRRIVTIGCSMTHGEEVAADKAWCWRVDAMMDSWEVANLGVAAYGIDQCLLRLRREAWALDPDEVWLGILPQAALRITTLYRPLLDHWSLDVAFKPRFVLDAGGDLELVECPVHSLVEVSDLLADQRRFLEKLGPWDPWIQRAEAAYAPRGSSLLHHSFVGRLALSVWEKGGRHLEPCFDDESDFGRLFSAIVMAIDRECREHGVSLRIVILPGEDDLRDRRERGRGYWEDWVARLMTRGMSVIDLSPVLEEAMEPGPLFMPKGHYTDLGNEIVAKRLVELLGAQ